MSFFDVRHDHLARGNSETPCMLGLSYLYLYDDRQLNSMLFQVHFFPVFVQSIFESICGRSIHYLLWMTFIDNLIAEEKLSHI